tara:strand:- start:4126 stop:4506 length:381 start_codon:yes stop_codon:yes gene_type:complete
MVILIFLFWLFAAFVIGFMGSNKKIGYWGTFFLTFLFSPIVGIIVALVSPPSVSSKLKIKYLSYKDDIEKAKMAENRDDKVEALRYYKDALYRIENAPKTKEKAKIKYRLDAKKEILERIDVISNS